MIRSLSHPLSRSLCMAFICLALLGCNEEKEKKVLAQTTDAINMVQAQKVAADLANTAQQLLIAPAGTTLNTADLKTIKCEDSVTHAATKVISYIPKTASLAHNDILPNPIAQRIKTDLTARFAPENVVTTPDASCPTLTDIATNSPILQLDATFSNQSAVTADASDIQSVTMSSCGIDGISGKRIPGVITTKILKSDPSHPVVITKCGKAAPSGLDDLALTNTTVPDWKSRLTGTPGANTTILCLQANAGNPKNCSPIDPGDEGTKVICDQDSNKNELIVNPKFDPATATFIADSIDHDCGKGWSGEMISHIQSKQCHVTRSDGTTAIPATVIDIAYVGAKCKKAGVVLQKICPAGLPFSDSGMITEGSEQTMTAPEALEPKLVSGQNISSIAFSRQENGQTVTNASTATNAMIGTPQTLITATGTRTDNFFLGLTDPSLLGGDKFDQGFVDELTSLQKIGPKPGSVTCFARAQSCMVDYPPTDVDITVDRSSVMNANVAIPVYALRTTCQATMANLFTPDMRHDSCAAAKAWNQVAKQYGVTDAVLSNWNYHVEPVGYGHDRVEEEMVQLDYQVTSALNQYKNTMLRGLKSAGLQNRLEYGLAIGQDCNPPTTPDGLNIRTQEDMFGSCAPQYIPNDQVEDTFKVTPTEPQGHVLRMCQSSCPGECVTNVDRNADYTPKAILMTKMAAIDLYVKTALIPSLPINSRSVYGELFNSQVDESKSTVGGAQITVTKGDEPVVLQDNLGADIQDIANIDPSFYWSEASAQLKAKTQLRGGYTGGIPLIYRSVDAAINRLRMGKTGTTVKGGPVGIVGSDGLDANPNKRTSLIIFGSKNDLDCTATKSWIGGILDDVAGWFGAGMSATYDRNNWEAQSSRKCKTFYQSPYFGRNFCEPEPIPTGYRCHYEVKCGFLNLGNCGRDAAIDVNDVKTKYGVDGWDSRAQWCNAKGYGRHLEVQPTGQSTTQYDNVNSFIGFMHRNFPNTRLYYFDVDGNGLSKFCTGTDQRAYDHTKPNIFVTTPHVQPWLNLFAFVDDISKVLREGIDQATGGGTATDEAGKYVCEQKYAGGATISYEDKPMPPRTQNFNQISTGTCDPLLTLNPDLPPGVPTPPPLPPTPNPYYGTTPYTPVPYNPYAPTGPTTTIPNDDGTIPDDGVSPINGVERATANLFINGDIPGLIKSLADAQVDEIRTAGLDAAATTEEKATWATLRDFMGATDADALTPVQRFVYSNAAQAYTSTASPTAPSPAMDPILLTFKGGLISTYQIVKGAFQGTQFSVSPNIDALITTIQ